MVRLKGIGSRSSSPLEQRERTRSSQRLKDKRKDLEKADVHLVGVPGPSASRDEYMPTAETRRMSRQELMDVGRAGQHIARSKLHSLKRDFDSAFYDFYAGDSVNLPNPNRLHFLDMVVGQNQALQSIRHAGLLTGMDGACGGTSEVAGWSANLIDKADPVIERLTMEQAHKDEVLRSLKDVQHLLEFQHQLRVLCTQIRAGIVICPDIERDDWKAAISLCALAVLSELRTYKRGRNQAVSATP